MWVVEGYCSRLRGWTRTKTLKSNVEEVALIAQEIGAEVTGGPVHYAGQRWSYHRKERSGVLSEATQCPGQRRHDGETQRG